METKYSESKKPQPGHTLKQMVLAYRKVFNTSEGRKVLYDMMNQTNFLNTVVAYTSSGTLDPYESIFREGQRSVLMRIFQTLERDPEEIINLYREMKAKERYYEGLV